VGLDPGGAEGNLADGQVITQTQSALVLENLIGQFLFSRAAEAGSEGGGASK
jgi:phospholipid/cholesterol/gamma-HCH transport system substrate-binding protein